MPKFSIIIPVCGNEEMTRNCIDSIKENSSDYEIIIIDNGSDPAWSGPERIIRNKTNLGFPIAVNQGIEIATGDVIVILNNDTLVTPGWLDYLNEHLEFCDIVGPVTNSISGPQQIPAPPFTDKENLNAFAQSLYLQQMGAEYPFHRLVFFCVAIKKAVVDSVGVLDEQFTPGNFEDDDFCMRAIAKGFKLCVAEDVFIHHFGSATHKSLNIDHQNLLKKNQAIFQLKWPIERYNELKEFCQKNYSCQSPKKTKTLALVMVVKNEEKGIERAIKSCLPFVDEIVVAIDNATTDKTEEIARLYTSNIKHFDFKDDFAAARNFAHQDVQSDWILFLDGHEYLDKISDINRHLNLKCDAFIVPIEMENGQQFHGGRLYKKGLSFKGAYHEQIAALRILPYPTLLIKHDRVGGQSPATIEERNTQRDILTPLAMLDQLKKNPKDYRAAFHLGLYYQGRAKNRLALQYFDYFLKGSKDKSMRWFVYFNKASIHLSKRHFFRAFWAVSFADFETPGRWEIEQMKGLVYFSAGRYGAALPYFVNAFKINTGDQTFKPWPRDTAKTWNLIGECFFNLGHYFNAGVAFEKAAENSKDEQFKNLLKKRSEFMYNLAVGRN